MAYSIIMSAKALRNLKKPIQKRALGLLGKNQLDADKIFSDISPDLVIQHSTRAKRLALRVDIKSRKVNIVIPKRVSMSKAYQFALENKYWIREQLNTLPENVSYKHGTTIPVLGEDRTINVHFDATRRTTDIALSGSTITIHTNKEDVTPRLVRFLKSLAKDKLTELTYEKAKQLDQKVSKVDVKDTVSRWGSCSHDGKISFNWRLIFAPDHAFDYVVAHEVAHLEHLDHSPAFWEVCEGLSQNYSAGKSWMRRYSQELYRY